MYKLVKSSKSFRETVLQALTFLPHKQNHSILYKNPQHPENGYFLFYEHLIRFGTVYEGTTNFKLENQPTGSFTPSSFFVIEKNLKGKQTWTKGQHFHGAEFTIHDTYFEDIIKKSLNADFSFENFTPNFTYRYLPIEIVTLLEKMQSLAKQNTLRKLSPSMYRNSYGNPTSIS